MIDTQPFDVSGFVGLYVRTLAATYGSVGGEGTLRSECTL